MKTTNTPSSDSSSLRELTYTELAKVSPYFVSYPWEQKEAYVDFISNMYYFLSQACRLLTSAASRCDLKYDNFHHRFVEHAHEEKNHEKLVLHDLKVLKSELMPCLMSLPPIWQTQFFMIEHKSPLSLFGCILYLENLSLAADIGPQVYQRCLKVYGPKATTYLRVHVEEDAQHIDKLFNFVAQLPQHEVENVKNALLITSSLYKNFFLELTERNLKYARKAA